MSPKSALAFAETKYQKANIDGTIQRLLTASAAKQSVEQFVDFIMSTDIGLFILSPLSHQFLIVLSVLSQSSAHTSAYKTL